MAHVNPCSLHKQLLLTTAAVQRKALLENLSSVRLSVHGLAEVAQRQARSASVWAAVAAALWSVRPRRRRPMGEASKTASPPSGGLWSWARTAISLALALRPLWEPRPRESAPSKER